MDEPKATAGTAPVEDDPERTQRIPGIQEVVDEWSGDDSTVQPQVGDQ